MERETYPDHTGGSAGQITYGIKDYAYDAAQRTSVGTDQEGDTVAFGWDMADRLLTRSYAAPLGAATVPGSSDGSVASDADSFSYDRASRMTQAISGRYGNTNNFSYDDASRVLSESITTHGQTYVVNHSYDVDNRRTQCIYPDGTVVDKAYTDRDQIQNLKYQSADVATFAFDGGYRETSRTHGNTLVTTKTYRGNVGDPGDNLVENITVGGKAEISYAYAYDVNKNVTAETHGGGAAGYSFGTNYDNEDRLTNFSRTAGALRLRAGI